MPKKSWKVARKMRSREALSAAVSALVVDNQPDFRGALWDVVENLNKKAAAMLADDPQAAFDKYGAGRQE